MKLIRQNDEAGGLVLTQNLAGKARKQNYNFGRAWKSYNPGSAYIDINKTIPPNTAFSLMWFQDWSRTYTPITQNYINTDLGANVFRYEMAGTIKAFYNNASVNNTPIIGLNAAIFDGAQMKVISNASLLLANCGTATTNQIGKLILQRTTSPIFYMLINGLAIYDRALAQTELVYRKNENLGNELLNVSALWAEYKLNGAEILNTGGADFVGVRDSSGNNRHMPILSLPAGTLQQQLDWANLNCFQTW